MLGLPSGYDRDRGRPRSTPDALPRPDGPIRQPSPARWQGVQLAKLQELVQYWTTATTGEKRKQSPLSSRLDQGRELMASSSKNASSVLPTDGGQALLNTSKTVRDSGRMT